MATCISLCYEVNKFYFILSSEINAYQKQIKVKSITSDIIVIDIGLYFHCSVFFITSDFSIHLMQLTSKVQTPITFLFVNKTRTRSEQSSHTPGGSHQRL